MNDHLLAVVAWIHLIAIVSWLGLLINLALVFFPSMSKLDIAGMKAMFPAFHKRTLMLSSFAVVILAIAGTILTVNNEQETGPSHLFANPWMTLIVTKHILVGSMALLQAGSLFILHPRLTALFQSWNGPGVPSPENLEVRIKRLMHLDHLLSVVSAVLGCGVLLIIAIVLQFY